jgi:hypothetical protein
MPFMFVPSSWLDEPKIKALLDKSTWEQIDPESATYKRLVTPDRYSDGLQAYTLFASYWEHINPAEDPRTSPHDSSWKTLKRYIGSESQRIGVFS